MSVVKRIVDKLINVYRSEGARESAIRALGYLQDKTVPTVTDPSVPDRRFALKYLFNLYFRAKYGHGTNVMEEDWDTLVLLDACRFDSFECVNKIPGELQSRISQGVDSDEFVKKNFRGRTLHDTVYVTANPHVEMLDGDEFHDVVTEPLSEWDSEIQCVLPEQVTQSAIRAHQKYPRKRIIVHYMQPHDPPLGPTARELREEHQIGGTLAEEGSSTPQDRVLELVARGEIPVERARTAYRESLDIVLSEVSALLSEVSGKIVVSSDHGELFGEQPYPLLGPLYEHYRNPRIEELCRVPWFIPDFDGERRDTVGEEPVESGTYPGRVDIEQQLEALGYK